MESSSGFTFEKPTSSTPEDAIASPLSSSSQGNTPKEATPFSAPAAQSERPTASTTSEEILSERSKSSSKCHNETGSADRVDEPCPVGAADTSKADDYPGTRSHTQDVDDFLPSITADTSLSSLPSTNRSILGDQTLMVNQDPVPYEDAAGNRPRDRGYLPYGWTMVYRETEHKWKYTCDEKTFYDKIPPASGSDNSPNTFKEIRHFPDSVATVQIVDFKASDASDNTEDLHPTWHPRLRSISNIKKKLGIIPAKTSWRWIHCTGLHAPTLEAVAEASDWDRHQFARIFSWTRPSIDWDKSRNILLVLFESAGLRLFVWHRETNDSRCPVLITCATNIKMTKDGKPITFLHNDSVDRFFDFMRIGCSRPDVVVREDRTLVFYGIVRAIIQYLRQSAFDVRDRVIVAYEELATHPSTDNLGLLLSLKETAALLALDLISFKKAVQNLNAAANEMHRLKGVEANFGDKPAGNNFDKALKGKSFLNPNPKGIYLFPSQTRPKPLLSVKARDMLVDQMGLIRLLDEELPVIINLTDTFNSHVFNSLGFRINTLLKRIAWFTALTVPFTFLAGVFGANYEGSGSLKPKWMIVSFGGTLGVILLGIAIHWLWPHSHGKTSSSGVSSEQDHIQRAEFATETDIQRANEARRSKDDHPMKYRQPTALLPPGLQSYHDSVRQGKSTLIQRLNRRSQTEQA